MDATWTSKRSLQRSDALKPGKSLDLLKNSRISPRRRWLKTGGIFTRPCPPRSNKISHQPHRNSQRQMMMVLGVAIAIPGELTVKHGADTGRYMASQSALSRLKAMVTTSRHGILTGRPKG